MMFRTLFVFILCLYTCPLLAQHSAIDSLLQGKIPGLNVTHSSAYQRTFSKEELFEQILRDAKVSINLDSSFYIVDSNFSFFTPIHATKSGQGMQILRSFAKNSDPYFVIGLFVCPGRVDSILNHTYWTTRKASNSDLSLRDRELEKAKTLMNGYDRFYKKNSYSYLLPSQLKKINACNGAGILYEINISNPFKEKYDKCKILAVKNREGDYISLYYFYNSINDKKITKIILSQLGMVKFR